MIQNDSDFLIYTHYRAMTMVIKLQVESKFAGLNPSLSRELVLFNVWFNA